MTFETLIKQMEMRPGARPPAEESLARVDQALRSLKLPLFDAGSRIADNIVLIAGTNGKGSVSKTLETVLLKSGRRVGLFTSPHLFSATERIRTAGSDLTKIEFVYAFELIADLAKYFLFSHFETLVLMMAEVFFGGRVRPPVDIALIEVGVGGRVDPTRLIPHATTVITRLGLDHRALLGPTIELIAREKFGAIDHGNLVVHAPLPPGVKAIALESKAKTKSKWIEAPLLPHRIYSTPDSLTEPRWDVELEGAFYPLSLMGARAVENTSVALTVLRERFGLREESAGLVGASLAGVHWPARMERVSIQDEWARNRRIYVSGDHNPQGVRSLGEILHHFNFDCLHLIVGIGSGKEAGEMLQAFSDLLSCRPSRLYLTSTSFRRSEASSYGDWLSKSEGYFDKPRAALESACLRASSRDLIVVTGSLYLLGEMTRPMNKL